MAQHNMKKKTSLPSGAKQKSIKRAQRSATSQRVRKGGNIYIAPKKAGAVLQAKINTEVSRVINDKNEHVIRMRADTDIGKVKDSNNENAKK